MGGPRGMGINQLITIVVPGTIHRWVREAKGQKRKKVGKRGRPKKPLDLKKLVLKIARDTGWGYTRGLGEIRDPAQDLAADGGQHHARSRARARSEAGREDLGRVRQNPR